MRFINLFKRKPIVIITMPDIIYNTMAENEDLFRWSKKLSKDYHVLIYPLNQSQEIEVEIYK